MRVNPSGKIWVNGRDPVRENIKAYYRDETVVLPPHQMEILGRLKSLFALYLTDNFPSRSELINKHCKEFGIDHRTALRDWEWLQDIAKVEQAEVALERSFVLERYREAMQMARLQGDTKGLVAAVKGYAEAAGVNNHESEAFTPDKLEAVPVVIMLDPVSQAIMAQFGKSMTGATFSSSIDLSSAIETVDYETIKTESEQ